MANEWRGYASFVVDTAISVANDRWNEMPTAEGIARRVSIHRLAVRLAPTQFTIRSIRVRPFLRSRGPIPAICHRRYDKDLSGVYIKVKCNRRC